MDRLIDALDILDRALAGERLVPGELRELRAGVGELLRAAKTVVDHDRLQSLTDREINRLDGALRNLGMLSAAAVALAQDDHQVDAYA
ncbi:hypothetical protein [Aquimonas sp.]|jgi:hypothetical protein|uniref:hypothetical protein n=1 Tax=Aquimonas sp. TaxID=1872588 RepID=UPI0037BF439E